MTFHVGQKVVCIGSFDSDCDMYGVTDRPIVGSIYTIRDIDTRGGSAGLRLEEVHNPPTPHILNGEHVVCETAFVAIGFRPVVEKKTDISIFTALLKTQPVKALALATGKDQS